MTLTECIKSFQQNPNVKKMESRSQIVQKFINVGAHTEQCFDFEIKKWLEHYEKCNHEPINFSEAAFLIISAAKIYGRKVDYLEQILYDFNRRSAANVAAAAAVAADNPDELNNSKEHDGNKRKNKEKETEKAQKRTKRLLKLTNKIEFKPKPFTIAEPSQISLNMHEQRNDMDDDELDQLRLKNVFPRINILQSNLQNNNSFYDNLGIVERNGDNLDSLRDFRIFMDTIDEPMEVSTQFCTDNRLANTSGTTKSTSLKNAPTSRGNQKHFNAYLSADYIKENYGVEIEDNSDYLNMVKYGEEIERLNLRKLTIEQLSQLKVGTYLNNILHGNKQDCKISEHDSGIDMGEPDSINDSSSGINDTSMQMDTTTLCDCLNTTTVSGTDSGLDTTLSQSINDTTLDPSSDPSVTLEVTEFSESTTEQVAGKRRQSLDDGLGSSLIHSPVQMADLDSYERSMLSPVVEVHDIFYPMNKYVTISDNFTIDLNGPMKDMFDINEAKSKVPALDVNIFQLPEQLLRRSKQFKLTPDFDIWLAARKRKATTQDNPRPLGKLLKLSSGAMVRADADSDDEEFLGFSETNQIITRKPSDGALTNPANIENRSPSSDSGIISEKILKPIEMDVINGIETNITELNGQDSGIGCELNDSSIVDQSVIIMDASGTNINANSTQIYNESHIGVTEMDSGFSDFDSVMQTTNDTLNEIRKKTDDITEISATSLSTLNTKQKDSTLSMF